MAEPASDSVVLNDEREEVHSQVLQTLTSRVAWENKQSDWDMMMHDGIPRMQKPFPFSADFHWPLARSIVNKYKPFYFQQLFSMETLADFTPLKDELKPFSVMVGAWFTDKLKTKSNLKHEIRVCIQKMLQSGQTLLKTMYDTDRKRVRYDAVDPVDIIVPEYTEDLQETDWLVHVIHLSVASYKRHKNWNQDKATVEMIRGNANRADSTQLRQQKMDREGFTYTRDANQIIVWEVFRRNEKGNWMVDTYAPQNRNVKIREEFELPFKHGRLPFVPFYFEITDKSYYSGCGIPEQVSMYEAFLNKMMNEKSDAMTFTGRPIYTTSSPIPNVENLDLEPGSIVPGDIRAVVNPPPPIDYQSEENQIVAVAQNLTGSPDLGVDNLTPDGKIDNKTATEANIIAGLNRIMVEDKSDIFRDSLTEMYEQSYSMLLQFDRSDLDYLYQGEMTQLDKTALAEGYRLTPRGSPDAFTRQQLLQKAFARKQVFAGSPFIRQDELDKTCLELDDPRLIKRLYMPQDVAAASQAEDQAMEIGVMRLGFPAQVKSTDNHNIHLQTISGYVEFLMQTRQDIDAIAKQRIGEHAFAHIEALKKSKNTVDKQNAHSYETRLKELFNVQHANQAPPQSMAQAA